MLFAVAEALAVCQDAGDDQTFVAGIGGQLVAGNVKGYGYRLSGFYRKRLLPLGEHTLGFSVEQLQMGTSTDIAVAGVSDECCGLRLVIGADETRQVGLYHHCLLGYNIVVAQAIVHLLVVCQSQEVPGGDAFRQGERQTHVAIGIGHEVGEEEGGLVEVVAQRGRRADF